MRCSAWIFITHETGGLRGKFPLLRLLGEGKVSQVDDMQKEVRFTAIASNDFHENFIEYK